MKYTTKVTSEQSIRLDEKTVVTIKPKGGSIPDEQARAVAETKWGKRLIEAGFLTFDGPLTKSGPGDKASGDNAGGDDDIPDFDKDV
jgi:hypothetical protein